MMKRQNDRGHLKSTIEVKNQIRFNLIKSVLLGLIFPTVFLWLFFIDKNNIKPMVNEYRLITWKTTTTNGFITKGKAFEGFAETDDNRETYVSGYEFNYIFYSNKGDEINSETSCYGELPGDKKLSQIPYQVSIEYLEEEPTVNHIIGLRSNNESLWDLFRRKLFFPLLIFTGCCYIALLIIKKAICKFKIEMTY